MNRANSLQTHVGHHRSRSGELTLAMRVQIQKWLSGPHGPASTGNPHPGEVGAQLVCLNSAASDTLHYRAPIVWDWSFLAAYGVHHRAVDVELPRHSGAATHQIACRQKEIDGF